MKGYLSPTEQENQEDVHHQLVGQGMHCIHIHNQQDMALQLPPLGGAATLTVLLPNAIVRGI